MNSTNKTGLAAWLTLIALWPIAALAHIGHGTMGSGGWLDGFLHPITGFDHVAAMVAVGLWGAQLGRPAIWVLPVTFPLVMAIGSFFGVLGLPLPGVVIGVAFSGIALGLAVACELRPPLWFAAVVVSVFAVFHGHTHGTAVPLSGVPLAFGSGFVTATGLLHLCGIVIGLFIRWPAGAWLIRVGGGVVAAIGLFFLATHFDLFPK
jgi:urease accessory protein